MDAESFVVPGGGGGGGKRRNHPTPTLTPGQPPILPPAASSKRGKALAAAAALAGAGAPFGSPAPPPFSFGPAAAAAESGGGGGGGGGGGAAAPSAPSSASAVRSPPATAGLKSLGGLGALQWQLHEDEALISAINALGTADWTLVAQHVKGRTAQQCMSRWVKALKIGEEKGPWTASEDELIRSTVAECAGVAANVCWADVAKRLPGRLGKQCRERWQNRLDPAISKKPFEPEVRRRAPALFVCSRPPPPPLPHFYHSTPPVPLPPTRRRTACCLRRSGASATSGA